MKKKDVDKYPLGSPEYVVAHAKWQKHRGRNLSAAYGLASNPNKAFMIAKKILKVREHLKAPMLKCLERVVGELKEGFEHWNKLVKEKAGIELNMELVSVCKTKENEYTIMVRGISFPNRLRDMQFKIMWSESLCPTSFNLFEWTKTAFDDCERFIYAGIVDPCCKKISKVITIYVYNRQIPSVLSRSN